MGTSYGLSADFAVLTSSDQPTNASGSVKIWAEAAGSEARLYLVGTNMSEDDQKSEIMHSASYIDDSSAWLGGAVVDVANDSFAFVDASESDKLKKESFADLATAMAGTGLSAANGVMAANANSTSFQYDSDELQFAAGSAGDGLSLASHALKVNVDDSTIETDSDAMRVKASGITESHLNTSVAGDGLAGGGGSALSVNVNSTSFQISGDEIQLKSGVDGDGLALSSNVLAIDLASSANGLEISSNKLQLKSVIPGSRSFSGAVACQSTLAVAGNATIEGDLAVHGELSYFNVAEYAVEDKNITLNALSGSTNGASNLATAAGAGLTVKGTDSDASWTLQSDGDWKSSAGIDILTGKTYQINGVDTLSATGLGSAVVASSLTSVGTIGTGVWQGSSIANAYIDQDLTISGGSVDSSVVGGTTAAAGTFTALTANDSLAVNAGVTIEGDTAAEVTLAVKGASGQSANMFLVEQSDGTDALAISPAGVTTAASLVATTADINGGTMDGATIGGSAPAAGTFTNLTANDDVTIGASTDDTLVVNALINSDLIAAADGTQRLGSSTRKWDGLYVNGAGAMDQVVIGASTAAAGTFTDLTATTNVALTDSAGDGTIDGVAIGQTTAKAGKFTTMEFSTMKFDSLDMSSMASDIKFALGTSHRAICKAWVCHSDVNLKENIKTVSDPIEKIKKIRGVSFDWKEDKASDLGFIAQEVGDVLPEICQMDENGEAKGVDYSRVASVLVEAVKEQQSQIEKLTAKLDKMSGE